MTTKELHSERESAPGPIEKIILDVEHAFHITEEHHSHWAPLAFFAVIALVGGVALVYRLAFQ